MPATNGYVLMIEAFQLPAVVPEHEHSALELWGKCSTTVQPMLASNLRIFFNDFTPSIARGST
jgi:hypothetical protein